MTSSPVELSIPALLEDHAWLAHLARALVRDPEAAHDLAQDTWLQALRSRARVASPRGWLAQIARNQAKRAARTEQRRARREGEVAPQGDAEAASEVAARFEVQRKVVEAVAGLEQPFRDTVLLHWFQGLSLAEVARAAGVPEGTVRWRLHRAHELLRERLASVYGERDWRPVVALLTLPVGRAGASVSTLMVLAGLLLFVAGATYALWPESGAAMGNATVASASEVGAKPAPANAARDAVVAGGPSVPAANVGVATASPRADEAAILRAVLVDARTGAPVRGTLAIGSVRFGALSFEVPDLARWLPAGASDAAGTVALPLRVTPAMLANLPEHLRPRAGSAWQLTLAAQADGYAHEQRDVVVVNGDDFDLGRIALTPVGTLTGRVVDAQGKPLAGVEVVVVSPPFGSAEFDVPPANAPRTTTAAWLGAGTFRVAGVRRGPVVVWLRKPGFATARMPFSLAADEAAMSDLALQVDPSAAEPPVELRHALRVVVRAGGAPSLAAMVKVRSLGRNGRIDSDRAVDRQGVGVFDWRGDASEARVLVSAWDRNHEFAATPAVEVDCAVREVVIDLPRRAPLRVLARDAEGRVIGSAKASWTIDKWLAVRAKPTPQGLLLSVPPAPARLLVEAEGYAPAHSTLAPDTAPGMDLPVTLHPYPRLRGRVLAGDRPAADARVTLLAPVAPHLRDEFRTDYEAHGSVAVAADGSFSIACPVAATVQLRAAAAGFASTTTTARIGDEAVIELRPGVSVQGRVHDRAGRVRPRAVVALNDGFGTPRTVRTDREGRYRFDLVARGRYELRLTDNEIGANGHSRSSLAAGFGALPAAVEVGDRDVTHDLCVDLCQVAVELQRGTSREPLWRASLKSAHDDHIVAQADDPDGSGRFALGAATPGDYVLQVRSLGGPFGDVRAEQRVTLQPGAQTVSVSLDLVPASFDLLGAVGKVARLRQVRDGAMVTAWLTRDAAGRYVAPLAPVGACELFDGSGLDRPLASVVVTR